jgi:hypothetical protein
VVLSILRGIFLRQPDNRVTMSVGHRVRNREGAGMSTEFDQLVAEFERFQSRLRTVDDRMAGVDEMRAELGELQASATSPDRGVTVVAGPNGTVLDVQFTDEALRQSPQAWSAAWMSTLGEAVAASARQQAFIVDEHLGGEMGLTDQVLETQAELFGTSVEEMRTRLEEEKDAKAASAPPAETPHDDFSEQSFVDAEDERPAAPPPPKPAPTSADDFLSNLFDEDDHR